MLFSLETPVSWQPAKMTPAVGSARPGTSDRDREPAAKRLSDF